MFTPSPDQLTIYRCSNYDHRQYSHQGALAPGGIVPDNMPCSKHRSCMNPRQVLDSSCSHPSTPAFCIRTFMAKCWFGLNKSTFKKLQLSIIIFGSLSTCSLKSPTAARLIAAFFKVHNIIPLPRRVFCLSMPSANTIYLSLYIFCLSIFLVKIRQNLPDNNIVTINI